MTTALSDAGVQFADATVLPSAGTLQQFNVGASVASNALTVTFAGGPLAFRNATLTSGIPVNTQVGALSLTVPSTATLGTISAVQAQLALVVLYNSGVPQLGIVNLSGGVNLDETILLSTTAISTSATSASVVYSTSAVTSSPFRVVGYITITEATAGTWATAPTLVQGAGGLSFPANSVGMNQTWQTVTRVASTTYYNTTSRPLLLLLQTTGGTNLTVTIGSYTFSTTTQAATSNCWNTFIVPPGQGYSFTGGSGAAAELR